jgi:hypothetical protein
MRILPSAEPFGVLGIVGHVGCGHVHSNHGFIQDDSGGLAAILALLQEAFHIPLTIIRVDVETGRHGAAITVTTAANGRGRCTARRGISHQEAALAQAVLGQEAVRTQALAIQAFGRVYGQGAQEVAVALQTAIANAALDSFARNFPDHFHYGDEGLEGNCGKVLGTVLNIEGCPVSVMGVVNATEGGIGPVEDLEGNVFALGKKAVMVPLHLDRLPTIIVEGKAFVAPASLGLKEPTWIIRAHADYDNLVVAEVLEQAAKEVQQPALYLPEALKRDADGMTRTTREYGDTIAAYGQRIGQCETALEKARVIAELIAYATEDAGGVSFMTNRLHAIVGGNGNMPGTAAVLSLLIPEGYLNAFVQPFLSESDVRDYVAIIKAAVTRMQTKLPEALAYLERHHLEGNLDWHCR